MKERSMKDNSFIKISLVKNIVLHFFKKIKHGQTKINVSFQTDQVSTLGNASYAAWSFTNENCSSGAPLSTTFTDWNNIYKLKEECRTICWRKEVVSMRKRRRYDYWGEQFHIPEEKGQEEWNRNVEVHWKIAFDSLEKNQSWLFLWAVKKDKVQTRENIFTVQYIPLKMKDGASDCRQ